MRKSHIAATLLFTAILCFCFVSCSDNTPIQPEQSSSANTEETVCTDVSCEESSENGSQEASTAQKTTTAKHTTVAPTTSASTTLRPTTTAAATTAQTTTQPTTAETTTKTPEPTSTTLPTVTSQSPQEPTFTTPPNITDEEDAALETELLRLINVERRNNSLPVLTYSPTLSASANIRAEELSILFSHTRPDGSSWNTVGELVAAENIASGQPAPQAVSGAWMASSAHKANILNPEYTLAAVGCYYNITNNVYYWVLHLGK